MTRSKQGGYSEDFKGVANSIWNNGLCLSFLSGFAIALNALVTKLNTGPASFLQIVFCRSILIGCFMFAWSSVKGDRPRDWLLKLPMRTLGWLLIQSASAFGAIVLTIAAYKHIPLGDAAGIFGATPVFTGLMGMVLIGEAWQMKHAYLSLLAWSGIALIYKPQFLSSILPFGDSEDARKDHHAQVHINLYWGGALLVPVLVSLSAIITRKLARLPPQLLTGLKNSGFTMISFLAMVFTGSFGLPPLTYCKYLIPDVILAIITQTLLGRALQREKAAPVTLMKNSKILVSFILQYAIYGTVPGWSSLAGAGLIILATALLAIPGLGFVKRS